MPDFKDGTAGNSSVSLHQLHVLFNIPGHQKTLEDTEQRITLFGHPVTWRLHRAREESLAKWQNRDVCEGVFLSSKVPPEGVTRCNVADRLRSIVQCFRGEEKNC